MRATGNLSDLSASTAGASARNGDSVEPLTRDPVSSLAAPFNRAVPGPITPPANTASGSKRFAIAKIGQARQALADMLMCYARLLQSAEDSNSRQQLRAEMSGLLVDKDSELLTCMMELAGKRRSANGPRVLELFQHLKTVAERYETAGIPSEDPAWNELRAMAEMLLAPYQNKAEEILDRLTLSGAALKFLPDWLIKAHTCLTHAAAIERVHGMLSESPSYLLTGERIRQAVDVLDELVVAGTHAEAETLATHLASATNNYSKEDRVKAVRATALLLDSMMDQNCGVVVQLENSLLQACARETSEVVLKPILSYLLERAVSLYNRGYFDRAVAHAETIETLEKSFRKSMGEEVVNPVREACADLCKGAWAQALPEALLAGGEREAAAAKMLSAIDKNVSTTLISCIGREENVARAQIYARHFKQMCPGATKALYTLMSSQNDPVVLTRMLAIASCVGADEEIFNLIFPLLVHSNFELRGSALQFILDRDNERTATFIGMRLRDPRCAPQRDLWMSILTRLKHPAVAQVLVSELQIEIDAPMQDDRRMMALIEACGGYDDPRIGTVLLRLLRPQAGLNESRRITVVARENAKTLKLIAMKTLARYVKDPRVFEALERLRREPDPDIQRMAAYSLSAPPELAPNSAPRAAAAGQSAAPMAPGANSRPAVSGLPGNPQPAATRRAFDALEQSSNVESIFRPGASISGKHPLVADQELSQDAVLFSGKQVPLDPSQLPEDIFAGAKPLLEGELQDLGLGMTARITCAKNGVMLIKSSLGKGAIYIQNKTVVAAFLSGMTEIQALAAIGKLKQAHFAYYAKSFRTEASMNIEVSNIETAIREYLDMH